MRDELDVSLPKDARTLLKAPRISKIVSMDWGRFCYFGLLEQILCKMRLGTRPATGNYYRKLADEFRHLTSIGLPMVLMDYLFATVATNNSGLF
jgi:hypothetical protein